MSFTDPTIPVPTELRTDEFVLRPLTAADAELDYAAVMETRVDLRLWEQSTWPADDFTVEDNRLDLIRHADLHAAHRAFTYTVLDLTGTTCLGCVYLYPITASFLARSTVTSLDDEAWEEVDAVVYFWVRASQAALDLDERLLATLRAWLADIWHFQHAMYVVSERFAHQIDLLERTDLQRTFALREPGKSGTYILYGDRA